MLYWVFLVNLQRCLLAELYLAFLKHFNNFLMFIFERKIEWKCTCMWVGEGQRDRETEDLKWAPRWQQTAWYGAQTHEPRDHDLSQSRMINWPSHPGTPVSNIFNSWRDAQLYETVFLKGFHPYPDSIFKKKKISLRYNSHTYNSPI